MINGNTDIVNTSGELNNAEQKNEPLNSFNEEDIDILRSDAVSEMLEKPPSWLIRWGSLSVVLILLLLFIISFFVKYPDKIQGYSIITSDPKGQIITLDKNSKMSFVMTSDSSILTKETIIAVIDDNQTDYDALKRLKKIVGITKKLLANHEYKEITKQNWPQLSDLGDAQLLYDKLLLLINRYTLKPEAQYIDPKGETTKSYLEVYDLIHKLDIYIRNWEKINEIKSVYDGTLYVLQPLPPDSIYAADIPLFAVVPFQRKNIAVVNISTNIQDIRPGQRVIFELDEYPSVDYGIVEGKVDRISKILYASNDSSDIESTYYRVFIKLDDNIVTSLGRNISVKVQTKGKASIITNDKTLLERLFNNAFKY